MPELQEELGLLELLNPLVTPEFPELSWVLELLDPLGLLELLHSSGVGCLQTFCDSCFTNFPSNSLKPELSESSEDSESEDAPSGTLVLSLLSALKGDAWPLESCDNCSRRLF